MTNIRGEFNNISIKIFNNSLCISSKNVWQGYRSFRKMSGKVIELLQKNPAQYPNSSKKSGHRGTSTIIPVVRAGSDYSASGRAIIMTGADAPIPPGKRGLPPSPTANNH
jgi:hypothetical protein